MSRVLLVLELLLVFVVLPLGYRYSPIQVPALPLLWLVAGYALWQLWRDKSFDRSRLWNPGPVRGQLATIVPVFIVIALLLWIGVHLWAPKLEWSFARRNPGMWAAVMVLYPVLSVFPQGILYRAFFLHRYQGLLPETPGGRWTALLASAAAFAFLHIIFRNSIAVVLTFFGGILFAWRYARTGSLLTSSLEHALYGCWLFTVGLGGYFYHGVWPELK